MVLCYHPPSVHCDLQPKEKKTLFIKFLSELKPEGYVPVGKHAISPWDLVEGAKGGCNVAPWQELGGVRIDKQLLKMEVCVFD